MKRRINNKRRKTRGIVLICALAAVLTLTAVLAIGSSVPGRSGEELVLTVTPVQTVMTETPDAATESPSAPENTAEAANTPDPAAETATPAQTAQSTPEATPVTTPEATPQDKLPLAGVVIGIDPGHQLHGNSEKEPQSPGSDVMKKKVSSGTEGVKSHIAEHVVNLAVGILLRDMLEEAGATVYMTRTTADVNISNVERAQFFNDHNVDLGIRLHCNGTEDSSVTGAFMLVPADKNYPYYNENIRAAKLILEAYGDATGISVKKGITYRSDQTGFNWCERPIVNIEMGHMSNPEEDLKLTDSDFQKKMARGIYNGIIAYFTKEG